MSRTASTPAVAALLLVLAVSAGCAGGKSGSAETSAGAGNTSAGAGCSDSAYTEAVSSRLVSLNKAVIGVDAGHGDIALLDAAAPGLVSAAGSVLATAQVTMPCRPELVRADTQLLAATKKLSLAGHTLTQMTAVAEKGEDYSGLDSQFLSSYFSGTDGLQASLAALRSAGVPPLVKATGGRAIFLEAGCSSCHTLAAANAKGTAGPDLDEELAMLWVLNQSDGSNSLLDIAQRAGVPFGAIARAGERLQAHGLLRELLETTPSAQPSG